MLFFVQSQKFINESERLKINFNKYLNIVFLRFGLKIVAPNVDNSNNKSQLMHHHLPPAAVQLKRKTIMAKISRAMAVRHATLEGKQSIKKLFRNI